MSSLRYERKKELAGLSDSSDESDGAALRFLDLLLDFGAWDCFTSLTEI
jgi:hypothetical protein